MKWESFKWGVLGSLCLYSFVGFASDVALETCSPCEECSSQPSFLASCGFRFGAELGYKKFNHLPSFDYGFALNPPSTLSHLSFLHVKDNPDAPFGEAFMGFTLPSSILPCWLGDGLDFYIAGSVWMFTDSLTRNVLESNPALVLPAIDGVNGLILSIGIPFQSQGAFKRRYTYAELDFFVTSCYCVCFNNWSFNLEPFIGFSYNKFNQRYGISLLNSTNQSPTEVDLSLSENLYTDYYDFGGGVGTSLPICECLFFCIDGGFYGSYADTLFKAKQVLTSRTGSTVISSSLFQITDTKELLSYKFKGGASLNYQIGNIILGVGGKYEYWNYVPQVKNPQVSASIVGLNPAQIHESTSSNYTFEARALYAY